LKKTNDTPLYLKLKEELYDRITSCEWRPGDMLPSESELITTYDVSRVTVRQALSELQHDGVVIKKQGKGTFVNPTQVEHRRGSMYTFSCELRSLGIKTGTKLIDWKYTTASPKIASILKLGEDKRVLQILRIRYSANKPFALEYSYLPCALTEQLSKESVIQMGLYHSLSKQCNIIPEQATETFSAVNMTAEQAAYLDAKERDAAFHLQRISECRDRKSVV